MVKQQTGRSGHRPLSTIERRRRFALLAESALRTMTAWFSDLKRAARRKRAVLAGPIRLESRCLPAVILVTTNHDTSNTSDGLTTLREAIDQANSQSGDDTIRFASGIGVTITLRQATLNITSNIRIEGPGSGQLRVERGSTAPDFGVFTINAGATVFLGGMTIAGGRLSGDGVGGGGIANLGNTTGVDLVVTGNEVRKTGPKASGGAGIANGTAGTFSLERSRVTNNQFTVAVNGSPLGNGIINYGTMIVRTTTISGNTGLGGAGGGVWNASVFTLEDSTVSDHGLTGGIVSSGGGLYNNSAGTMTIVRSTVSNNRAESGGAIESHGQLTFSQSTASGNGAFAGGFGTGGGLSIGGTGTTRIRNSTITNNTAQSAGSGGGLFKLNASSTITVESSIIAGNSGSPFPNVGGSSITDGGFNILSGDPGLGPLADNGGPTRTHVPNAGSRAIDQGKSFSGVIDQRGFPRSVDDPGVAQASGGDGTDIGAVEIGGKAVVIGTPSGTSTTEAGGDVRFNVSLSAAPSTSVTVTVSSSDTTEGSAGPTSLVFTTSNWSQPQTVTVTGVNDADRDGDVAYNVTFAVSSSDTGYNGLTVPALALTNRDDDTGGTSNPAVVPSGLVEWFDGETTSGTQGRRSFYTPQSLGTVGYAPGKVGQAYSFDGNGGYLSIDDEDQSTLDPIAGASLEAWIKVSRLPSAAGRFMTIAAKSGDGADLDLQLQTDDRLYFYIADGRSVRSSTVFETDRWYHVAGTYDAHGALAVYVNGVREANLAIPLIARIPNANPFTIGASAVWGNRNFHGLIDEVSVYNRPLAAAEISAIFGADSNGKDARRAMWTVNTLSDLDDRDDNNNTLSLREAMRRANETPGVDSIYFHPSVTGVLEVGSALPNIASDMDIVGSGVSKLTIRRTGTEAYRLFTVEAGVTTRLVSMTIQNGSAVPGGFGGAVASAGNLTLQRIALTGNQARFGGAVANLFDGRLIIESALIAENTANFGAAVSGDALAVTMRQSTISGNTASQQNAIYLGANSVGVFHGNTITNNVSGEANAAAVATDKLVFLRSNIVARNFAAGTETDVRGNLQMQGFNLLGDTRFGTLIDTKSSDRSGVDPLLEPLADNGGFTKTHALKPGSPALDAGPRATSAYDQRGYPRTVDLPGTPNTEDGTDIGAFERSATTNKPPTISVIAAQSLTVNGSRANIPFRVDDPDTPADNLQFAWTSSNPDLLPIDGITVTGSGRDRFLALTPARDRIGQSVVELSVTDGEQTVRTSFVVDVVPGVISADRFESNDTLATAANLGTVSAVSLPDLSIHNSADTDFFRFTARGTARATIRTEFPHSLGDLDLRLLKVDGTEIGSSAGILDFEEIAFDATAGETYFVQVYGFSGAVGPRYRLLVTNPSAAPTLSPFDPQQRFWNSPPAELPFRIGDPDTPLDSLRFSFTSSNAALLPVSSITVLGIGPDRTLRLTPLPNRLGTTEVEVSVTDGEQTARSRFRFEVVVGNILPDSFEPNNSPATASDLGRTSVVTANGLTLHNGDNDFFRFTAPAGGLATARVDFAHALGNVDLQVFTSGGGLLSSSASFEDVEEASWNAVASETYLVRAFVPSSSGNSSTTSNVSPGYRLSIGIANTPPTVAAIENASMAAGSPPVRVSILVSDLESPAGSLRVTAESLTPDVVANSGLVLSGSGVVRALEITPVPDKTGRATIRVTVSDGGLSASRTFELEVRRKGEPLRLLRAYNPNADYHFFTISRVEFDSALRAGYRDESTGQAGFEVFSTQVVDTLPVYRLYNLQTGRHYYTTNLAESDSLVAIVPPPQVGPDTRSVGWRFEKIEGYVNPQNPGGLSEVYRLYNTNSGVHLYTENPSVRDAVLAIEEVLNGVPTGRHPWQLHSSFGFATPLGGQSSSAAFARTAVRQRLATPAVGTSQTFWIGFDAELVNAPRKSTLDSHAESRPSSTANLAQFPTPAHAPAALAPTGPGSYPTLATEANVRLPASVRPIDPALYSLDDLWTDLRTLSEILTD